MPSGKSHDFITFLIAAPVFAVAYAVTWSAWISAIVTVAFLFGGLMFGPDLDTTSKQYSRWRFFRFLWFPYRTVFKHRSRWSHGLVFGPPIRVVYFLGILTICILAGAFAAAWIFGEKMPDAISIIGEWKTAGGFLRSSFGGDFLLSALAGMWAGAVSHSLTDIAVTYVKTGRVSKLF